MNVPNTQHFDPTSSLLWRYDAVHGYIDIRDATDEDEPGTLAKLLKSPILERLRRIKQLGFASKSYPAADHSRYAHSLGTMHIMRAILNHLSMTRGLPPKIYKDLHSNFPKYFNGKEKDIYRKLVQHMLIAALIQDVGELPFCQSTRHIYRPSFELRESVKHAVGFDIYDWSEKNIFTIACITYKPIRDLLNEISIRFLVYLITGGIKPEIEPDSSLVHLRHIVDGVVDADRLDYVFRDAHHAIGGLGTPSKVIESLLYYDEKGPVFSDPGPVSNFFATRIYVQSTIHASPANRFHVVLLLNFLRGVLQNEICANEFFGPQKGELSLESFLVLDDIKLMTKIKEFYKSDVKRCLDQKTKNAIELIVNEDYDYQCLWLPPKVAKWSRNIPIIEPDDLFVDTFTDQHHISYNPGSVRINSDRFRLVKSPILLEQCSGPFNLLLEEPQPILPMPRCILLFLPKNQQLGVWQHFYQALEEGWLYEKLIETDPFGPLDVPSDTREMEGFDGLSLFISYSQNDLKIVRKIASFLYIRRKRYYLLLEPYQGVGDTAAKNSIEAVVQAEALLILASLNYAKKYKNVPDGNIAKEISTMVKRKKSNENLKIVVLSVDNYLEIKDELPWQDLGFDRVPFVGDPLRDASDKDFKEAIEEVLKVIDS